MATLALFTSDFEIFQKYENILRKHEYDLQDKVKLKDALAVLVRCLSLLPWNEEPKPQPERRVLHAYYPDEPFSSNDFYQIIEKLEDLVPVLVNSFENFFLPLNAMTTLEGNSVDAMISILHSLDLIVRSFVYGANNVLEYSSSQGAPDVAVRSVLLEKLFPLFPLDPLPHLSIEDNDRLVDLNMVMAKIFFDLNDWISLAPDLLEKILEFLAKALLGKVCRAARSGKAVWEKHLVQLLPFIPKFVSHGESCWTSRLLQAFTLMFLESEPSSSLKLACLSAIENMLEPIQSLLSTEANIPESSELKCALSAWIRELPLLLIQLGDEHPVCSRVVLHLLLRIGQRNMLNNCMYDNMQPSFKMFYSTHEEGELICYGPFLRLPKESQELAFCCLYYFSHLDVPILQSVIHCCLSPDLDPHILFRIIEVLHSAYRAGNIKFADHLSCFITLGSRFKVSMDIASPSLKSDSRCQTLRLMTRVLCDYMQQMGDPPHLLLQTIEKTIIDQIMLKPPLDNGHSLITMIFTLDSKPTRLSEQSITTLGHYLSDYLIDAVQCIPEGGDEKSRTYHYYLLPCYFLFDKCHELMNLVLKTMGSVITDITDSSLTRVNAVTSILVLMHKDAKLLKIMSLFKEDIDSITQKVLSLQSSSEMINMTIEERRKLQCSYDQLKVLRML